MQGPEARLAALAAQWRITIAHVRASETSLLAFGTRGGQRVVLKIAKAEGDEWRAGEVAAAFAGHGVVGVLETAPGAVLMEEVVPGTSLVDVVSAGHDDQATRIVAAVIRRMLEVTPPFIGQPAMQDWGKAFGRYLASGDATLERELVEHAARRFDHLRASQRNVRLLHGDLQHYNILEDEKRGWLAIDAKGVAAEIEVDVCAALRNPHGRPDLITTSAVERRIGIYASELNLAANRIVQWAYVLGVLSAIWDVEDGHGVRPDNPALMLVAAVRPLLP